MATIDSMNKDSIRLSDGPDWTFELLDDYLAEIDRVAKLYRLDTYPHQIEVITSEQMMDAYSSVGMPINYPHWSFGKKFIETERLYKHGQQGLNMFPKIKSLSDINFHNIFYNYIVDSLF